MLAPLRYLWLPFVAAGILAAPVPSDPIGIYAIADRVILLPDSINPQTIQVWGVFAVSEGVGGDHYKPATRGYMYFKMDPRLSRQTVAEWQDMKTLVGKGIFGFGAHYATPVPRVRCATEPPANPDTYAISVGIVHKLADPPNTIASVLTKELTGGNIAAAPCPR